ncbi:hypothetical protein ACFQH6_03050 [Halobacteriaceae archaeon GCM10025711]
MLGSTTALTTIGTVLVEALALYVAYGALTTIFGDRLKDAIREA